MNQRRAVSGSSPAPVGLFPSPPPPAPGLPYADDPLAVAIRVATDRDGHPSFPPLLTLDETAALLRLTGRHVYRLTRQGLIAQIKTGRLALWDRESCIAYLLERRSRTLPDLRAALDARPRPRARKRAK